MKRMKMTQRLSLGFLGLTCAVLTSLTMTAHAQRDPTGTNEIAFADFDTSIPSWDYGYFYSDGNIGGGYYNDRFFSDPPDYTNYVNKFTFDSTLFAGFASWWGTGFGMPLPWAGDPLVFNSLDLADYVLSFDARVEGLNPGQTTGNCVMEFRLGTPGAPQWALVKALPYNPGSNWTHFVFNLDQGSYISADNQPTTSYTTFTNGIAIGITAIQFNQNQPNPVEFGADADNAIYMDNIKLQVIQYAGPPPPPPPKVPLTIFEFNFDDKGLWWLWPNSPDSTTGWSANANKATYWGINNAPGGIGGSQAVAMGMDNSLINIDPPGKPAWAGGNVSMGGQGDYSQIKSGNLKDYQLTFSARAEGLADGAETTPLTFQIYFNAPDDTLQPPDGNTDRDTLLRLNMNVTGVSSNWTTFTKSLNEASVDSGSVANLQAHFSKVDEMPFQLQILNPMDDLVWGLDNNNQILVDNVKLAFLVTGTPPLSIQQSGNNMVVTWGPPSSGTVKLQSADSAAGPYTEVVGATSPYNYPMTTNQKFFRTLWVPPTP